MDMAIIREAWLDIDKGKFTDMYVGAHPALRRSGEQYAREYSGDFSFMVDMRDKVEEAGRLTLSQVRGVLNCAAAELRRDENKAQGTSKELPSEAVPVVPSATYTVVLDETTGDYVTLRIADSPWAGGMPKGTQCAQYLAGRDNDRDFVGFAFVIGGDVRMWSKFKDNKRLADALAVVLDSENQAGAREAYALISGRCARCGRKLTVPASIHRGLGPECAEMIGVM